MRQLPSDEFRYVPGIPGYCVSRNGRVFSCRSGRWRELARWANTGRRILHVWVFVGPRGRAVMVPHRVDVMVYTAFKGPIPAGMVVAPADGDCGNLDASNLVAVQRQHGRFLRSLKGGDNGRSVLTEGDVVAIRRAVHKSGGEVNWELIAEIYGKGTSPQNIKLIARGSTWRHVDAGVPFWKNGPRPKLSPRNKLTVADVRRIKQRLRNRETPRLIHGSYPQVRRQSIIDIAKGRSWKGVVI